MSTESKIILYNKQNGTTTEIIDNNSDSNVSKKFILPDISGKLITEENASSIYLTKASAESISRKLEDSYSKVETDNKLSEKLAVSTYNTDKGTFATKNELGLKADKSTTYTKTETYNKTEVTNLLNTKANSNSVVNLSGNQTINGVKTFSSVPVSATNPTANNQVANKAYVDTVGNTAVKLTGDQTIAGTKTFRSPVVVPNGTANNHAVNLAQLKTKADINYVKKRGGFVNVNFNLSGGQGILIDLNLGINFNVIVQSGVSANMRVINAASNIGQSGEIYVANGAGVSSFSAPFNFRVAQSGFGANEVFSYLVVNANLVRITRS